MMMMFMYSGFGGSRRLVSWKVTRSKLVGSGLVCRQILTTLILSMKEWVTVESSSSAVIIFQLCVLQ